MEKNISTQELRAQLGEAIDSVRLRGDRYIIERRGKPVAALVPVQVNDAYNKGREELYAVFKQVQDDSDQLSEDEAMALANEAVREVRQERKARKKLAENGS